MRRWAFPLLVGIAAVPACFFLLPPQEALDRWFFASIAALPFAGLFAVVARVRGMPLHRALLVGGALLVGAAVSHVALPAVPSIHDRRFCEAHQRFALESLREAARVDGASASCSASEKVVAAFDASRSEHFTFHVERAADGCVFSALGNDFQSGCELKLVVRAGGTSEVERGIACVDKCR